MTQNRMLPVVLLPGFMLDTGLWDDYLQSVGGERRFIPVLLPPGESFAAIAGALLAQLPERFVVAGFSMGGYVARAITEQAPERVAGMILIATSLRDDTPQQKQRRLAAADMALSGRFNGLSPASVRSSLHPDRAKDMGLIERIRQMSIRLGAETLRNQSLPDRKGITQTSVRCPVLVIRGCQDALRSPEEADEIVRLIRGAKTVAIDHCGHMIPLEQPVRLAEITLRWLAENNL